MLCLGGVYAWSFFVPLLEAQLGFSHTQTQLIIGFSLGFFALSMLFTGSLEKRLGPGKMAFLSTLFLFSGYKLAAISGGSFPLVFFSVSLLTGLGIAFGYVTCLVTPARNFPKFKGLAVGISVAGFGGGAIVLTQLAIGFLSNRPDLSVLQVLDQIGNIYGIFGLLLFAGIWYPFKAEKVPLFEFLVSLQDRKFNLLFFTMFSVSFAGLLVLSNLKTMVTLKTGNETVAVYAISLFAFSNMMGRIIWGWFLDKAGPEKTISAAFIILISSLVGLEIVPSGLWTNLMVTGIAFGYSFCFVAMPFLTLQLYGPEKFGSLYPFVFLGYGAAGILGPFIAGLFFDYTGSFFLSIHISAFIAVIGLFLFLRFRKDLLKTVRVE
jgi:OFA family oxalate/formate antiporter-like MFS transporter